LAEKLVHHGVDNLVLHLDRGVFGVCKGPVRGFAEEPVGLGQNIGLVGDRDERRLVDARHARITNLLAANGDITSHGCDAEGRFVGNTLDGLGDLAVGALVRLLLLDVEVFGILADNDQVNGFGGRHDGLDGANICIQVEALAEGDNGRRVALDSMGRGADGAEEGTMTFVPQHVDGGIRERTPSLLEGLETRLEIDEVELEVEVGGKGLKDTPAGGNDFLADTVTGDEPYSSTSALSWVAQREVKGGPDGALPIFSVRIDIVNGPPSGYEVTNWQSLAATASKLEI